MPIVQLQKCREIMWVCQTSTLVQVDLCQETGQFIKCSQQPTTIFWHYINAPIFSNVASSNVQAGFLSSNSQRFRVSATSCTKSLNSEDLQLPVGIPIDSHRTTGSHQLVPGTSTIECARKYPQINISPPSTAVAGTLMALPIWLQPYICTVKELPHLV